MVSQHLYIDTGPCDDLYSFYIVCFFVAFYSKFLCVHTRQCRLLPPSKTIFSSDCLTLCLCLSYALASQPRPGRCSNKRGETESIAEFLYAHYNLVKALNTLYPGAHRDYMVEDGGDYDHNDGGYDQLGFGTALLRLD
jgi:hypothetical protein